MMMLRRFGTAAAKLQAGAGKSQAGSVKQQAGAAKPQASSGPGTPVPPPSGIHFPQVVDKSTLDPQERASLEAQERETKSETKQYTAQQLKEIAQVQSKYYQPKNPLAGPGGSKAELIRQKIASIEKRLEAQRLREEQKLVELERLRIEAMKPHLRDFKRPAASCLLLAVSVYMLMQYGWYYMEGQDHLETREKETREYEQRIQALLDEQKRIVEGQEPVPEEAEVGVWERLKIWWWRRQQQREEEEEKKEEEAAV